MEAASTSRVHSETSSSVIAMPRKVSCIQPQFINLFSRMIVEASHKMAHVYSTFIALSIVLHSTTHTHTQM